MNSLEACVDVEITVWVAFDILVKYTDIIGEKKTIFSVLVILTLTLLWGIQT